MKTNRRTRRAARELYRFCLKGSALDEGRARLVARHLAASRRRGALTVLSGFQRLVRLDCERHRAVVESAAPLGEAMREELRQGIARTYGSGIDVAFAEHPPLIGGIRIKVGSDVYDGSVRARLAELQSRL